MLGFSAVQRCSAAKIIRRGIGLMAETCFSVATQHLLCENGFGRKKIITITLTPGRNV